MSRLLLGMDRTYGPGIKVTRGNVHYYLGMDFDYSTDGKVKLSMIKYAKEILNDFLGAITSTSPPTADHLSDS